MKVLETGMTAADMNQVHELVDLLNDVKSTIKIFILCGKGIKWLAVTVGTISGLYYGAKHFLSGL